MHMMSWGASSFLAPIVGSIIIQRFGAPSLWTACLFVGAVAALLFRALQDPIQRRAKV
jgi:hypothetical protein